MLFDDIANDNPVFVFGVVEYGFLIDEARVKVT